MKKIKSFIATVLTSTLLFSTVSFAENSKAVFNDVDTKTEVGEAILKMYESGYIVGYNDGSFKPNGQITRAELVRVFNQVFGYEKNDEEVTTFPDVNKEQWFYNDVVISTQQQYITGFQDNTFRPNENFTRQQVCVVLTKIMNFEKLPFEQEISDYVAPWAKDYVDKAVSNRVFLLEAENKFRATENITRGEVCIALEPFIIEKNAGDSDDKKEVTTKTTSNASSGGGGSSSSSSSGNNTSTSTTTTTTESTTETTTNKTETTTNKTETTTNKTETTTNKTETTTNKTETTTNKTETTTNKTETTTETTTTESNTNLSDSDREAILPVLTKVISRFNKYIIPNSSNDTVSTAASEITDALQYYVNDKTFDVYGAMNEFKSTYKSLSTANQEELQNLILTYNSVQDLLVLKDTFFAGIF